MVSPNELGGIRRRAHGRFHSCLALALLCSAYAGAAELSLREVPSALSVRKELAPPPAAVVELRFQDLFKMPVGSRGLEPSDALVAADGKHVRVVGFMVHQDPSPHDGFLLTSVPVAASNEDEPLADDLPPAMIRVAFSTKKNTEVPYLPGLLKISGVLRLQAHVDESTQRISVIQLEPDSATRRALSRTVAATHAPRKTL